MSPADPDSTNGEHVPNNQCTLFEQVVLRGLILGLGGTTVESDVHPMTSTCREGERHEIKRFSQKMPSQPQRACLSRPP
jgi:hypothetical protein